MLSFKSMRKTKLSLAMSALLVGGLFSTSAQAVQLAGDDKLGDAGIFQYFTAKGNWQTFFRVMNTSNQSVLMKVRFREAANSRELRDFIVALSPNDMWSAWTGANAGPASQGGGPGVRTNDTSCIFDLTNTGSTTFQWVNQARNLQALSFTNAAFAGPYDDGSPRSSAERLSEGYLEVIGIAAYDPVNTSIGRNVVHNQATGMPENCNAALNALSNVRAGTAPDLSQDVGNVLGFNAQLINVANGEGGGYDPVVLANFKTPNGLVSNGSLVSETLFRLAPTGVGHGQWPSLDSADPHSLMLTANGNAISSVWDADADGRSNFGGTDVAAQQLLANGALSTQTRNSVDLNNNIVTTDGRFVLIDINNNVLGIASEANVPAALVASGKVQFAAVATANGFDGIAGNADDNLPVVRVVASTTANSTATSVPPLASPAVVGNVYSVSGVTTTGTASATSPTRLTNIAHDNGAAATQPFAVRGGVDAVSAVLARTSVANEWAASASPTAQTVKDYFTQWVLTFPTKHYYVDLQDDPVGTDLFAPTLQDPRGDAGTDLNDAFAPFSNEFNTALPTASNAMGQSCENYNMQLWDREEAQKGFTSPTALPLNNLCNEVNVVSFTNTYATQGLNSAFSTVVDADQLPISGVTGQLATRGWARMTFSSPGQTTGLTAISDVASAYMVGGTPAAPVTTPNALLVRYQGLPVVGFMVANYATGNVGANHNAVNAHKYQRSIQNVNAATTTVDFNGVNAAKTVGVGGL